MAQSEKIGTLIGALIEARKSFKPLEKARTNPFFKSTYASLDDVLEATDAALAANGLTVIQLTIAPDGAIPSLRSVLAHVSGEWIGGEYPLIPSKQNDPQALGAAVTYARRYALQGLLGICAEDDDDGQRASGRAGNGPPTASRTPSVVSGAATLAAPPSVASLPPQMPDFDVPAEVYDRQPGDDSDLVNVVKVEEFKGVNKETRKAWEKFQISFSNGQKATTFDKTTAAEAQIACNNRLKVSVAVKESSFKPKSGEKAYDLVSLLVVAGKRDA